MTLSEPKVQCLEMANGDKIWYQNDQYHRTDGPAVDYADGKKEWFQNGERHRIDGPAIEDANGDKYWYQNNQLHRLDGPAIEEINYGTKYWYIKGQNITNEIEYWMKENDIPEDHNKWTDDDKILFKLTWS
jgi:hypothetical protein